MSTPIEHRKAARDAVDGVLQQIHELENLLQNFTDGDNPALHSKLDDYIGSLRTLRDAGSALQRRPDTPYEVPVELLKYIDDGGNPDVFITDIVRSAAAANEAAKGKVEAFRKLRDDLLRDVEPIFPETVVAYKSIRGDNSGGDGGATTTSTVP